MKFGIPWSVKGIQPEVRATARQAARRSGMSLSEWLNAAIMERAAEDDYEDRSQEESVLAAGVHRRLDELNRRIEEFGRNGSANHNPKHERDNQIAELIERLDRRLDQFINAARQPIPYIPQHWTPTLAPTQNHDLSGLQDQLRQITDHLEAFRRVGTDEVINALRAELSDIGRALDEALPKHTVDAIEKQIQELTRRITESRQSGIDRTALAGVERGLAEVKNDLRGLTPAENLAGFTETVNALSRKIDVIVSQRDPTTLRQLEEAITTLREMATHVASDEVVNNLAAQVQSLAAKIDHIEQVRVDTAIIDRLESRITKLIDTNTFKEDITRTQTALETVNGTLGKVVDRLAVIEKDISSDRKQQAASELKSPRLSSRTPPPTNPAPTTASLELFDHKIPGGDQPLEPGSGPPHIQSAQIGITSTLDERRSASFNNSRSNFIAAARRAAQAAIHETKARPPMQARAQIFDDPEATPHGNKTMARVKSLLVAASIVAIVAGSIQIFGRSYYNSISIQWLKKIKVTGTEVAKSNPHSPPDADSFSADLIEKKPLFPETSTQHQPEPEAVPAAPPSSGNILNPKAPDANHSMLGEPSLFNPPVLNTPAGSQGDMTGSISPIFNVLPPFQSSSSISGEDLPISIGGQHLRKAASEGKPAAAYTVALRFAEGHGVPVNLEEAARWYHRAASKGLAPAQFRYASMLEKGQGVKRDLQQARKFYLAAAGKGHAKAMHNLAVLYAEGIDGKPDYATAAFWFRKAANHGITDSQYNLGVLSERGLGTEKNLTEAYSWFALAAAQGDTEADRKRDEIAAELEPEQLVQAKQAAHTFVTLPQPQEAILVPSPIGGWDNASPGIKQHKPVANTPLALSSFKIGSR